MSPIFDPQRMMKGSGIWLHILVVHFLELNAAGARRAAFVQPVSLRTLAFPEFPRHRWTFLVSCLGIPQYGTLRPPHRLIFPSALPPPCTATHLFVAFVSRGLSIYHTGCVEDPCSTLLG